MKIAVLRALQLGDLLCAVPALRALRAAHPDAEISLVALPWARELAARFPRYLDRHVEFPGFPGMPERPCSSSRLAEFARAMQRERFDLVLQMHGDGTYVNAIAAAMGGRRTAGYYLPGTPCPDRATFLEWRARDQEVLRWLRLTGHLGIPSRGTHLEFPLTDGDSETPRRLGLAAGTYAILHPGSQLPSRRWPSERFAHVGDALAREGMRVGVTGGKAEAALVQRTIASMRAPAIDASGTTLGALGGLIAGARILVCNDTSVSHIAAAVGTPSVVIACGSDPVRWSPLDRDLHRVLHHDVECRPCPHRECPIGHPCALGVPVAGVLHETKELLRCAA